jgi:hypothetical protein
MHRTSSPESTKLDRQRSQGARAYALPHQLLAQAILPQRDPGPGVYCLERSSGDLHLHLMAPPERGLPWGRAPRLLLSWLATEAVRTRSRRIELGPNLFHFLRDVGLASGGGRAETDLWDQLRRLLASGVHCSYDARGRFQALAFLIASQVSLEESPPASHPADLCGVIELSTDFFRAVLEQPIPVDREVLRALPTPLALDLYSWLSIRASSLKEPVEIPWSTLAFQFGASPEEPQGFQAFFLEQAETVLDLYPAARLAEGPRGLILSPALRHVQPRG